MNRQIVRLAVLAAVGITPAHSIAGIPSGNIPELDQAPVDKPVEEAGLLTQVHERWKKHHRPKLDPTQPYAAETIAWVESRLDQVPELIGPPIEAEQRRGSQIYDLRTVEGRIDAVLSCVSFSRDRESCDLRTVLSADEAVARSKGTRTKVPPWLDDGFQWRDLISSCPDPVFVGGCRGILSVDSRTGQCQQARTCRRGRPFADGRVARLQGDTRTAAGEAWARVALEEHASVASFASHVLELMALGAPSELLADATRAQLDEVRHAELALGLARRFGAEVEIGPMDTVSVQRITLFAVLDSVVEHGCIGETLSAAECAIALEQTEDPEVRAVLEAIVEAEARHAALAWRTLAWGLPQLETADRARLLGRFSTAVAEAAPECPAGIGVLGGLAAADARQWALDAVVGPALAAVAA